MTTIDFYTHVDDRLAVAARLVAKAYASHGRVRVLTPDAQATEAQASFIPFLHILGTGSAAVIVGAVSELPQVGLRGAFALPALATLLAGLCAYRASHFVAADIEAKRKRKAAQR